MHIAANIAQAHALFENLPQPIGLVPTMGALHDGHLALVRRAREECVAVVASVFVNPLQFAAGEDLDRYPRDFEGDREKLARSGVDILFAPPAEAMYPAGFSTSIDVGAPGASFEGIARPTHFRGVATVVAKLLHIVKPDRLYLGQKDAQQTAVVRRMIRDLEFDTGLVVVPTVREADGLAISSRNAYLTASERAAAPSLHATLRVFRDALANGASKTVAYEHARATLDPLAHLDYLDIVDADTFEPIDGLCPSAFIIGAARFGATRLLDNLWIEAP
ncbi:MAG: pantoate--beta-alanine ligase [Vulcanimicrobiaceae bacterium]